MHDVINSEAFLSLPTGWKIFFGLIIALFLAFSYLLSFKGFRTLTMNFFKKFFYIARQEPLLMHQLFFNKEKFYEMIYRMNFSTTEKTKLFVIISKNKVDTTIKLAKEFIKENKNSLNDYSPKKLRALLFDLENRTNKKSNQLTRDQYSNLYGKSKGIKLWGLIYDSKDGYKRYWEEKNQFVYKYIDSIINSDTLNNEGSVRSLLKIIDISVELAIMDCENTFKNLNGQISELINQD